MKRTLFLFFPLALVFLAGCLPQGGLVNQGSLSRETKTGEDPLPPSTDSQFETIDHGIHSGIRDSRQVVIRDPESWRVLWAEHVKGRVPEPPLPPVDFVHEMVIAFFLGEKPTAGYLAKIVNLVVDKEKVTVIVCIEIPAPNGYLLQVLTQPFHIIKVPRYDLPVEFIINEGEIKGSFKF